MWGSSTSICMQQNNISPIDVNKIHIRTKTPEFTVQIPFLQQQTKNINIESFQVTLLKDVQGLEYADQFYLFCDNAKGFHRTNGKQTLLTSIANWDGDSNMKMFSMLNSQPFQVQKTDNQLQFIITKSQHGEDIYPQETEGQQISLTQQDYLFNIIINIMPAEE